MPGFKAGLTKISSLAASAALSFQHGKGFWDLYKAIQNDVNCDVSRHIASKKTKSQRKTKQKCPKVLDKKVVNTFTTI
jgi:hypothetical protein